MNEKLREALSLALQYVPAESKNPLEQEEIDKIHLLVKEGTKAIPIVPPVKPESGGKIAEIRNLFSPILNMFTVAKEQRKYYLKVDKESRKQAVYLNKIEIAEKAKIMKDGIAEKIKVLLDELG